MKPSVLIVAFALASPVASGRVGGVDVQVNEGQTLPTIEQLQSVLRPGDFVRDILGWSKVDTQCNLSANPANPILIPPMMSTLYTRVQAAGGRNFVTLAFNNTSCGQLTISGAKDFPDTDALRAEFAAYAVGVVKQVPALGGMSIWNEMNGSWNGGYATIEDRLEAYCLLSNAVITEVRKVDATLPIAIGASVGWNIEGWFISMFDTYGCAGKGDPTIWLDVHPYLTGKMARRQTDWQLWDHAIDDIRIDQITNPLIATEWGGAAANRWAGLHPTGNYPQTFVDDVLAHDSSWAGVMWYDMMDARNSRGSGLFDDTGSGLTQFGTEYLKVLGP